MNCADYSSTARHGAFYLGGGICRFSLWAPKAKRVDLELVGGSLPPVAMTARENGYFEAVVKDVRPGVLYHYRVDGGDPRPDPASFSQPRGVHNASQVVDLDFAWQDDDWRGLPLSHYILYELHVGTFTEQGTFAAVADHLDELLQLGVTALEIMPVAQFPGERNWGYDGVHPFAVQNSYGGPDGLWRLVDSSHRRGFAVVLDVVYNHLGPEGAYLHEFGHYFTDRYRTTWGSALNFDGPHSDEVRRFFIENALHWVRDFHVDALRLDATDAIFDESARPFLKELADAVHREAERLNRRIHVIEECSKNDPRHVRAAEIGGFGLDAVWNDDFHHSLHVLLTGESDGYYGDFHSLADLAKALREGFVYTGAYSPFRGRRHGASSRDVPAGRFVVCAQNHDQVGNRMRGERLSTLVNFEQLKLAAALVLLSPNVPLLFMGEEYGERAPFQYFVDHADADLIDAVRRGRTEEFKAFDWSGDVPDPVAVETLRRSKLDRRQRESGRHRLLWEFHRELIRLRKTLPPLALLEKDQMQVLQFPTQQALVLLRQGGGDQTCAVFSLGGQRQTIGLTLSAGRWDKLLDSADPRWGGAGSRLPEDFESAGETDLQVEPHGCALFLRQTRDSINMASESGRKQQS